MSHADPNDDIYCHCHECLCNLAAIRYEQGIAEGRKLERADVVAYGRAIVEFAKTDLFTNQVDEHQAKALGQFCDHVERGAHAEHVDAKAEEPTP